MSATLAINIGVGISNIKAELKTQSNDIKNRLLLILPEPIWNLQYETVNKIVDIECNNEFINAIVIKDSDESVLDSHINNPDFETIFCELNHNFDITYNNEKIATVFIYYNKSILNKTIMQKIQEQMLTGLVLALMILFMFRFALKKYVINHLNTLKNHMGEFTKNNRLENELVINTNDEFSFLANEFNTMKKQLQHSQLELEEFNAHLEEIIKNEVEKNRKKEQQLFEQSKFAQMGEMLGNIAHQWRQPLSAISTLASGTKIQIEFEMLNDADLKQNLDDIVKQTQFLSQTIDDFRTFLKPDKQRDDFELKSVTEKTLFIVSSTMKNQNITIHLNFCNEPIKIYGYAGELSQVILNILNNARDILKEKEIEEKNIFITTYIQDDYGYLEISDNGGGIPLDVLPKIFDPYFTTKHQSVGTGIGLYMSKEIVEKHHGGKLTATNNEIGAVFIIQLQRQKQY